MHANPDQLAKVRAALVDLDPQETSEWVESLEAVLKHQGPERAEFLLKTLSDIAATGGAKVSTGITTPYINTIPVDKQANFPGNRELERKIKSAVRWNAMALDPSFIICDESVSSLDVSVHAQVLNLLNDLKKEFGFTIIFISHDLSVVRYISDRIMVMHKGKIAETGPSEQIYFHPRSAYTQKLISSIPKLVN